MSAVITSHGNVEAVTYSPLSFRAVLAGWLVATGIAVMLYLGGMALGFSAFDAWHPGASAKGLGIGTAIWLILTWISSMFVGALFASWFDGHDDQTAGSLHGITVWGLSLTAAGLWLALGVAGAMHGRPQGGPPMHGDAMQSEGSGGHGALMGDGSVAVLQAQIDARVRDRDTSDQIVAAMIANKQDVAERLLAATLLLPPATAHGAVLALGPQISAAQADAKATADRASHYMAAALWVVFLSAFLGLIAAALGGWVGAGHMHRVYHLRKYPRASVTPGTRL